MPVGVDVDTPSRPPERGRRTAIAGIPERAAPAAAAIIVAVVVTALIALFTVDDGSSRTKIAASPSNAAATSAQGSTSATTSPTGSRGPVDSTGPTLPDAALSWLQDSLPRGATLLVDGHSAAAVTARGLRPVVPADAADADIAFVVETSSVRASAARYPAVAQALRTSVPVARFSSPSAVTIAQVTDAGTARLAVAAEMRVQADLQLLSNTAVHVDPAAAATLRSGDLDARPAGVLALLAGDGPIEIVRVDVADAERAAGRPARILDLRTDDRSALLAQLRALSGHYRVSDVQQVSGRALRVTWPVDVSPILPTG